MWGLCAQDALTAILKCEQRLELSAMHVPGLSRYRKSNSTDISARKTINISPGKPCKNHRNIILRIELLEDRTVPAVTPITSLLHVTAWAELNAFAPPNPGGGTYWAYDHNYDSEFKSDNRNYTSGDDISDALSVSSQIDIHSNVEGYVVPGSSTYYYADSNCVVECFASSNFSSPTSGTVNLSITIDYESNSNIYGGNGTYCLPAFGFIYSFVSDTDGVVIIDIDSDYPIQTSGAGSFDANRFRDISLSTRFDYHSGNQSETKALTATINWRIETDPQPDLSAGALTWKDASVGGGVKFDYSITGTALQQPTAVSFVWSETPNVTNVLGAPIAALSQMTATSIGSHAITIPGSAFTPAPVDKPYYLVAFIDSANTIAEASEMNNKTSSQLHYVANVDLNIQTAGIDSLLGFNPAKNEHYLFVANVTNQSPIPLPAFSLNWVEN